MPGPPPKSPATRQRTNKKSTATALPSSPRRGRTPSLPDVRPDGEEWHPQALEWWRDYWRSPSAHALEAGDIHGLYQAVELMHQYWTTPNGVTHAALRLALQPFGTNAQDRARLGWTVDPTAEPKPRPAKEPRGKMAEEEAVDPRQVLRGIKGGRG